MSLLRWRRYAAWVALFAMCLVALAPSVSKWLAAEQGLVWVDVCGPSGPEQVALSLVPDDGEPHSPALEDPYCGYCVLVHHLPFVPPAGAAFERPAAAPLVVRYRHLAQAPVTRLARRAHPPRAPPLPA
ncbi:MAG: DUF2946 domain-containing protein [Castellaniella sp.]|uniref:DUF2946 domain-containing protein n=1 Tax=Castellaniella sp. TaxID=1955812 RepID=UPI003C751390